MDKKLLLFIELGKIFKKNSKKLYLVGGTVRDYLLNLPLCDMDLCTDATPEEMISFLKEYDYDDTFKKYGYIKLNFKNEVFDITTLREELSYQDSRHPSKVNFVKNIEEDYKRRDFTINALYMDMNINICDFVNGQNDLKEGVLRFVGDPQNRVIEDPLRIVRAVRFFSTYNLKFEEKTYDAIKKNISTLEKINIDKIKSDIRKMKNYSKERFNQICHDLSIEYLLDMVD